MTNLTEKIDELQLQLATQHTAVMAAFTTANGLLQNIADRLQFPFAAGPNESAAQWLSRIHTNITSLRNTEVTLTNTRLASLITLATTGNTEAAATNVQLTNVNTTLDAVSAALGTVGEDADGPLLTMTENIERHTSLTEQVLGIKTGDADTTVVGYLSKIADNSDCACDGPVVDLTGCADPFFSCGIQFIPGVAPWTGNVHVARFCEPLPDGIEFGTVFGIVELDEELEAAAGFDGWSVYVESDGSTFAISPTDTHRYPTNRWVALPDVNNISISVDSPRTLTVTLCNAYAAICPQEDSISLISQSQAAPFTTSTVDISGYDYLYFGSSSDPYNEGRAELWIDGVLTEYIDPIPASGVDVVLANTGDEAYIVVTDTVAAYVKLRGCPAGE